MSGLSKLCPTFSDLCKLLQAAEKNDPEAQKTLNTVIFNNEADAMLAIAIGYKSMDNNSAALRWLLKAIECGNLTNKTTIEVIGDIINYYKTGVPKEILKNDFLVFIWTQRAADLGDLYALYDSASCYETAVSFEDTKQAFDWYAKLIRTSPDRTELVDGALEQLKALMPPEEKATPSPHFKKPPVGDTPEQTALKGLLAEETDDASKEVRQTADPLLHMDLLSQAIKLETKVKKVPEKKSDAKNLCAHHMHSRIPPEHLQQTFESHLKTAKQGELGGMLKVIECYKTGTGVTRDPRQALYWSYRAAEAGHLPSMFDTAERLEGGISFPADKTVAAERLLRVHDSIPRNTNNQDLLTLKNQSFSKYLAISKPNPLQATPGMVKST